MDGGDELNRQDQGSAQNRDAAPQGGARIIFAEACHIQQNVNTIADYVVDRTSSCGASLRCENISGASAETTAREVGQRRLARRQQERSAAPLQNRYRLRSLRLRMTEGADSLRIGTRGTDLVGLK